MIVAEEGIFPLTEQNKPSDSSRITTLKQKINDEDYLFEAIQRIAQVLSNEITGFSKGGAVERKRQ
jgi:hypothetical protein